jgi:hypothetical protein
VRTGPVAAEEPKGGGPLPRRLRNGALAPLHTHPRTRTLLTLLSLHVALPQLYTRDGEISLAARSTHYMWRDEAQPLIAEGVLTKVSDE